MPDIVEKPTKLNEDTTQKLEYAFGIGCSVAEAAFYAEVSPNTVRNWMNSFPEIKERIEQLQQKPILKARKTVFESLDKPADAQWYLERKKKDEFAQRTELTGNEGMPLGYAYTSDLKKLEEEKPKELTTNKE